MSVWKWILQSIFGTDKKRQQRKINGSMATSCPHSPHFPQTPNATIINDCHTSITNPSSNIIDINGLFESKTVINNYNFTIDLTTSNLDINVSTSS